MGWQGGFFGLGSKMNIECMRSKYKLPGDVEKDAYILPVSGGADSTYLAILLITMYPDAPWRLVFTDTGEEHPSVLEQLDKLETYIGRKIERLGETTLFALIDKWNGYLPGAQSRYCTDHLKRRPFVKWLEQFEGQKKWMFVGIRSDEKHRLAFTANAETEMPYIDMGIVREDVYKGLSATIGIPKMYETRTRSGCFSCPFQTRSERVGLLQEHPIHFHRASNVEKLVPADAQRHQPAPKLTEETGIAENWMSLPMPKEGSKLEGRRPSKEVGLFGDRGIFVGAELMFDSFCGINPFVWKQRVVSYSPTLAGLAKQLQNRYEHLLSTAEVYDMTPDEVRHNVKFAAYYIEAPGDVLDTEGPGKGSYTWHQSESYAQLSHIVSWATRVLHAHKMAHEAARVDMVPATSFAYEVYDSSAKALKKVQAPVGRVVAMGWHECHEPVEEDDIDETQVACPMCTI